jgi:hypothetical protein
MSSHSLCIHDIHLVHMHAIGVPKGVTLVEFEGMCHNEGVTPLGVKHALTFQSMSISITYMFIITCNIS